MTTTTTALRGGLFGLEPKLNGQHPFWLNDTRQQAFEWAAVNGFPTTKDEDWRYTPLGSILDIPFTPAVPERSTEPSAQAIAELTADLGGPRLVFVNGYFAPDLSFIPKMADGVMVKNLASALFEDGELVEPLFTRLGRDHHDAFTALNVALAEDGAFILVPADTVLGEPIHLVFVAHAQAFPLAVIPRSLVLVGARSKVAIVESYVGVPGEVYLTNAVTEVVLEEDAEVEHYKVQNESETAFHLAYLNVEQGRNSRFSAQSVALGSSVARHEVVVALDAEGAEVSLNGLFLPRDHQHHDNPTLIEHSAPNCISREVYKGVMDNHGHGVFNGRVIVHPGAFGTDAGQMNKNLLLTEWAEIDTRPRLEILADDVKCTHGAAVGQLDEAAVFYLRTRGLPEQEARELLIHAFVNEMLELLRVEPLRSFVEKLVAFRTPTEHRT